MKDLIKSVLRTLTSHIYAISSRADWENFKRNNIDFMYYYAVDAGWSASLINEKIINFFRRFKSPEKLASLYYTLRFLLTHKPVAPIIEYIVTTHCTMKCKECNTKIPYFNQDTHVHIDFATFKRDVDALLSGVDYVLTFGLLGGEPLLHKDLPKMLDYALKQKKIHNVYIATNCTLLPSPALLEVMKNKKFAIQISNYNMTPDLPKGITSRHDEFRELLKKNSIKFSEAHDENNAMTWLPMPELKVDKQDASINQKHFDNCFGRLCNMLCDGKITQCTISVYISRHMELTEEVQSEIVDIRTSTDLRRDLIRFYCRPYSNFCNYCHFEHMQKGLLRGEQMDAQSAPDLPQDRCHDA